MHCFVCSRLILLVVYASQVFCVVLPWNAWYADRRDAQEGWLCLLFAACSGQLAVVKYLVEVGGKELLMLVDKVCARECKCICSSCALCKCISSSARSCVGCVVC
jgi:hypothetical protein